MNITDIEDKIIRHAAAAHQTIYEYTAQYTAAFLEDTATLRLQRPEHIVKATDHIHDMVTAIQKLEEGGYTYLSDGSVYYRIAKFPDTASSRTTISAASAPAPASTWTNTIKPTPATSFFGKPRRTKSPPGRRPSAKAAPAGTSNAP